MSGGYAVSGWFGGFSGGGSWIVVVTLWTVIQCGRIVFSMMTA